MKLELNVPDSTQLMFINYAYILSNETMMIGSHSVDMDEIQIGVITVDPCKNIGGEPK